MALSRPILLQQLQHFTNGAEPAHMLARMPSLLAKLRAQSQLGRYPGEYPECSRLRSNRWMMSCAGELDRVSASWYTADFSVKFAVKEASGMDASLSVDSVFPRPGCPIPNGLEDSTLRGCLTLSDIPGRVP